MKGFVAGTNLRAIMAKLASPVEKARKVLDDLGVSIGTLNQDVYGANHFAKDNAYAFCKPGDVITFDNGTCYIYKLNGV